MLHRPEGQIVLVDTPGLHRPRTLLGQRLNDLVRGTLSEVDLVLQLVDAAAGVGAGDRFLAAELAKVVNAQAVRGQQDGRRLPGQGGRRTPGRRRAGRLRRGGAGVGAHGTQLDLLEELILRHLPEGRPLYPEGHTSDEPEQHLVAELIREKALALVRDELPHSVAVLVEEMGPDPEREDLLVIRAFLFVERASQKPIVVGKGGAVLRESAPGPGPSSRPCSAARSTST